MKIPQNIEENEVLEGFQLESSRALMDRLIEGCVVIDRDERCLYANPAAEAQWMLDRDASIGQRIIPAGEASNENPIFAAIRRCLKDGIRSRMNTRAQLPGGNMVWLRLRINPVPEGALVLSTPIPGTPEEEVFIAADTVPLVPFTDSSLLRLTARLERLITVIQDLSHATALDSVTDIVRIAARELTGADGATFVLRDGDQCHYVDESAIQPLWKGRRFPMSACISGWAMLNRRPAMIEDIYTDQRIPHDAYRPTFVKSLAMVPIRSQNPLGAIGVYWARPRATSADEIHILQALADSTAVALENVQILSSLERSEKRYRDLVENLDAIVYLLDPEGTIQYVSPSIEKMGYGLTELLGRSYRDVVHHEDLDSVNDVFRQAIEGNTPVTFDFRMIEKSGSIRYVRGSGRGVHENGNPIGVTGIFTDRTRQRRIEEQLVAAQKMEVVGRLAGGVAHDFNNYLSVMMGYTDIAMADAQSVPLVVESLNEILRAGNQASLLTRQLMSFSRSQVLQPAALNLNDVVTSMEKMVHRLIGEDIVVETRLSHDLWHTWADPGQIEQVIMNLVVNARDAMPNGGRITIETRNVYVDPQDSDQGVRVKPGAYAALLISDDGIGMDEATRNRIFEPFFTTKPSDKGTGLGLSIVYGIIGQSDGHISVYSEPGMGSTFKILLPRKMMATDVDNRESGRPTLVAQSASAEAILVVEDEDSIRRLLERILRLAGYFVLLATNGEEALEIFRKRSGDIRLVITDVVMPKMGGPQLAKYLTAERRDVNILFMSGYTDHTIVRHGVLEPGVNFLSKPLRQAELLVKIREILDGPVETKETEEAERRSSDAANLTPGALRTLSSEIVDRLVDAATAGDAELLRRRLSEEVRPENPLVAAGLGRLAENYEYDRILEILSRR